MEAPGGKGNQVCGSENASSLRSEPQSPQWVLEIRVSLKFALDLLSPLQLSTGQCTGTKRSLKACATTRPSINVPGTISPKKLVNLELRACPTFATRTILLSLSPPWALCLGMPSLFLSFSARPWSNLFLVQETPQQNEGCLTVSSLHRIYPVIAGASWGSLHSV